MTSVGDAATLFFTPLKDTKAFECFQQKLEKEKSTETIGNIHYLPDVNRLFFEDAHPLAVMYVFLRDVIMDL